MKILSHRGVWNAPEEKNTRTAFIRSFSNGFGIETDVRDYRGDLVISHDIPVGKEMSLLDFLELADFYLEGKPLTLAINIKADGLAEKISELLKKFPNLDCFFFDMSVPDTRAYINIDLSVFIRMSEVERDPPWLEKSSGLWLDSFDSDWYDTKLVEELLLLGKPVCIVSPELHGRDSKYSWQQIADLKNYYNLMICTDYPLKAKTYFGVK